MNNISSPQIEIHRDAALFIRSLTTIDSAIFDPASGVFGQSWYVDIELQGKLDDQGFVYDFSHLKNLVRQVLKDTLDHALIIPVSSRGVDFCETKEGEQWRLHARSKMAGTDCVWDYICPNGAAYPIRSITIKSDSVEQELARTIRHRLPPTVTDVKITLREEAAEPTAAFFRYTHGIAGHKGLCQRLFHGHRSRLEIFIADERRPDLEHYVTRELLGSDVHIATPSQFHEGFIEPGMRGKSGDSISLRYRSEHGEFMAKLPADRVFVVEKETSIECFAHQLALIVKAEEKTQLPVRVFAYEGINKGSIAIV